VRCVVDPFESAKAAHLRHINDEHTPGIRRLGKPGRFRYVHPEGVKLPLAELQRIHELAIPPAWTNVWICPDARGHIQATGRDARGRKQYRYHAKWREVRDEVKYHRVLDFARALPRVRERTARDIARSGLPREKVIATVVQLLERTLIRVGNDEYERANGSIGLTTMHDEHAKVRGATIHFEFRGKSGIQHAIDLRDRRLARIVKQCRHLPGYELFQYVDGDGRRHTIDSSDVNAYLREITNDDFTAKDFRTWAGTVLAACALAERPVCRSATDAKRQIAAAIEGVARTLGNTKAVCRKCYVHPAVVDAYVDGHTIVLTSRTEAHPHAHALTPRERAVVTLLERRLRRKTA
jgi:DNA topoisomerase-1